MDLDAFFRRIWQDRNPIALGLWPLSLFYRSAVALRKFGYGCGLLAVEKFNLPIMVIGNLTVGGTGKTPLTIWTVEFLQQAGFKPGVISRGYGRRSTQTLQVSSYSTPDLVGDEPLVIWHRTGAPVAVANRRADAVRLLMKESDCDILVSDDGLQHLALSADLKILLIDGQERFGNGFCLPAGPLREGSGNTRRYDLTVVNGTGSEGEFSMECKLVDATNLLDGTQTRKLSELTAGPITAFAGIRHSNRFFELLREQGIESDNYSFPDHHEYTRGDFNKMPAAAETVLMTEKDAVKCAEFAAPNWWSVRLEAMPERAFQKRLSDRVASFVNSS